MLRSFDVQLIPGRAVERTRRVRADLRGHAQLGEEREGSSGGGRRDEVEVERDGAAAAEMHRSGRMKER